MLQKDRQTGLLWQYQAMHYTALCGNKYQPKGSDALAGE